MKLNPLILVGGLALVLGCSGQPDRYQIQFSDSSIDRSSMSRKPLPKFLLVSDTQHAVPFTDYELAYELGSQKLRVPPELSTLFAKSFYRGAASHLLVPMAFDSVIEKERKNGLEFGLFGGDMIEFACKNEATRVFSMLEAQGETPFIITLGNHDSIFHGSLDTDAVGRDGAGQWDSYAFDLWGGVCARAGGKLTKSGFIEQVLAYYANVWKLDVTTVLPQGFGVPPEREQKPVQGQAPKPPNPRTPENMRLPRGEAYQGTVTTTGWRLEFDFQLSFEDGPQAHRQSHLYQRFTRLDASGRPTLAFTSLDTTDYAARPALCASSGGWVDAASRFIQVGLAGAVSNEQVRWLEERPLTSAMLPHFVLSHYLPFENVAGLSQCDSTFGSRCLGRRMMDALHGGVFIYGHVHQHFEEGVVERLDCGKRACGRTGCLRLPCDEELCERQASTQLVRLPSLIDNKAYVLFNGKTFHEVELPKDEYLRAEAPFAHPRYTTCQQRCYETVELQQLLACTARPESSTEMCPDSKLVEAEAAKLANHLCRSSPGAWVAEKPANQELYKTFLTAPAAPAAPTAPAGPTPAEAFERPEGVCHGWPEAAQWRCVLRGLAYDAWKKAAPTLDRQRDLAAKLLPVVEPLRKDRDPEHR